MKKLFTFLVVSSFLFAAENPQGGSYTDVYTTLGFFSDLDFLSDKSQEFIPALTVGKRSISKNGNGIDYGATFGYLERKEKKNDFVLMFPRMEYIRYGSKGAINGYAGIGGCVAMYRLKQENFEGIVGNLTFGADFYREKNMNGFAQVKTYYPLLSIKANEPKGSPIVFIDVGLGF